MATRPLAYARPQEARRVAGTGAALSCVRRHRRLALLEEQLDRLPTIHFAAMWRADSSSALTGGLMPPLTSELRTCHARDASNELEVGYGRSRSLHRLGRGRSRARARSDGALRRDP